jgi:hypothetical protein
MERWLSQPLLPPRQVDWTQLYVSRKKPTILPRSKDQAASASIRQADQPKSRCCRARLRRKPSVQGLLLHDTVTSGDGAGVC